MKSSTHRTQVLIIALALATGLFCAGCSTASKKYIPQTIGNADPGDSINGITVSILPSHDRVVLGRPLTFEITIANTGLAPMWIPKDPQLILVWVYPNGHRDNVVQEEPPCRYFNNQSAVLLEPGTSVSKIVTIRTHYFPKPGITEFRAILRAAENTNPRLSPFWCGRALSNAYGVLVHNSRYRT